MECNSLTLMLAEVIDGSPVMHCKVCGDQKSSAFTERFHVYGVKTTPRFVIVPAHLAVPGTCMPVFLNKHVYDPLAVDVDIDQTWEALGEHVGGLFADGILPDAAVPGLLTGVKDVLESLHFHSEATPIFIHSQLESTLQKSLADGKNSKDAILPLLAQAVKLGTWLSMNCTEANIPLAPIAGPNAHPQILITGSLAAGKTTLLSAVCLWQGKQHFYRDVAKKSDFRFPEKTEHVDYQLLQHGRRSGIIVDTPGLYVGNEARANTVASFIRRLDTKLVLCACDVTATKGSLEHVQQIYELSLDAVPRKAFVVVLTKADEGRSAADAAANAIQKAIREVQHRRAMTERTPPCDLHMVSAIESTGVQDLCLELCRFLSWPDM